MKLGQRMPNEQRAKIAVAMRGKQNGLGCSHCVSPESRIRMSESHKGKSIPIEVREKMSASMLGKKNALGSKHSPETRAKISEGNRGKTISLEQRAKLSMANTGKVRTAEVRAKESASMRGKKQSPETIAKRTIALTGRQVSAETRAKIGAANWRCGRKISSHRDSAKRRLYGFIPLNAWFQGCDGHHVDNEQVINIPKALHRSIFHRQSDGLGMAKINAVAYNYLFKQEVEAAMAARGGAL